MTEWLISTYWICLLVGIIYTFASLLLGDVMHFHFPGHTGGFTGGHGGFSHDYGVHGHGGHGVARGSTSGNTQILFGPFSPLVVAFFLTCFGAFGVVMRQVFSSALLNLGFALLLGVILAWLLIVVGNRLLGGLQVSSEVHVQELIGTEAEVTVGIPETGIGQIAYVAMGGRSIAPARSDDQTPIARFTTVQITRVVGNIFFVRPVVDEQLRALDRRLPAETVTPSRE